MGRFLNTDALVYAGHGLLGFNMFAYCLNNPVNYIDVIGYEPKEVLKEDENQPEMVPDNDVLAPANTGKVPQPASGSSSSATTSVVGSGHGNPQHKNFIDSLIKSLFDSGKYLKTFGNRALSTAGQNGGQRPDIIAIGTTGLVEAWEVASPSQAYGTVGYYALEHKIGIMRDANPDIYFHDIIPWESIKK